MGNRQMYYMILYVFEIRLASGILCVNQQLMLSQLLIHTRVRIYKHSGTGIVCITRYISIQLYSDRVIEMSSHSNMESSRN